jgi:hypothetical protein
MYRLMMFRIRFHQLAQDEDDGVVDEDMYQEQHIYVIDRIDIIIYRTDHQIHNHIHDRHIPVTCDDQIPAELDTGRIRSEPVDNLEMGGQSPVMGLNNIGNRRHPLFQIELNWLPT